jgi:TonB family protein
MSRRAPLCVSLLAILCCTTLCAHARALDASAKLRQEPGVSQEGDAAKAEETCTRGAELSKQGDARGALEAFRAAARLYVNVYRTGLAPEHATAADAATRFRERMRKRLRRAPECIDSYMNLGGAAIERFERSQFEALRGHVLGLLRPDDSSAVFTSLETDARATVTARPEPRYPRDARGRIGSVTVRLRVILGADGRARDAFVMAGPPDTAFLEASVEAAKGVRFRPAVKDGRAVSQFLLLEYNFSTY